MVEIQTSFFMIYNIDGEEGTRLGILFFLLWCGSFGKRGTRELLIGGDELCSIE